MDNYKVIILILLIVSISACGYLENRNNQQENKKDDFYTVSGGWDWIRVPLLKPYEAKKADPEIKTNTWSIDFLNSLGTYNVKRIDVQDSIIYILSGKVDEKNDSTLVNLRNVPTGWYVIDTRTKAEKGFASEEEFKSYIKENNYPLPKWHDLDSLSIAFSDGKKLPWQPK